MKVAKYSTGVAESNEKISRYRNLPYLLVAIALIIVGISNPIVMLLALSYICILIVVSTSATEILMLLFFLLPFSSVFVKNRVGGFPYYLLVVFVAIFVLFLKNNVIVLKLFFPCLLLVAYVTFLSISSYGISVKCLIIISGILFVTVITTNKDKIDVNLVILYYSLGIILASILGMFSDHIPMLNSYLSDNMQIKIASGVYIKRFCGLYWNPNYFSFDITVAFAGMLIYQTYNISKKIADYVIVCVLLIFGLLSISQSFVISTAITLVVFVYYASRTLRKRISNIFFVVVIFVAIWVFSQKNEAITAIINRFLSWDIANGDYTSITSKRSDIWISYLNEIFSNMKIFFWGNGISESAGSAHSLYIETVYFFGVIGTGLFTLWYFSIIAFSKTCTMNALGKYPIRHYYLILLIPVAARAFAISLIAYMNYYMTVILILLLFSEVYLKQKPDIVLTQKQLEEDKACINSSSEEVTIRETPL